MGVDIHVENLNAWYGQTHTLKDINLQIPANAAIFYVYCSIAAAPPLLQRSRKRAVETEEEEPVVPASEVV